MTKRKPKVPNPADLFRNAINLRLQDADFVNLVRLANSQGMNATRLARALISKLNRQVTSLQRRVTKLEGK